MNRKVLIGLVGLGAAVLFLRGRRRRSSLSEWHPRPGRQRAWSTLSPVTRGTYSALLRRAYGTTAPDIDYVLGVVPVTRGWSKSWKRQLPTAIHAYLRGRGVTDREATRVARRASSLDGLGYPAVRHSLFRSAKGGAAGAAIIDVNEKLSRGDCRNAFTALLRAEYESGHSSAHAISTADEGTQKLLAPGRTPRTERAAAAKLRKAVRLARAAFKARCLLIPLREKRDDPRQGMLFGGQP